MRDPTTLEISAWRALAVGLGLAMALGSAAQGTGWSTTDPMSEARYAAGATLLPSGRVLVAGGTDGVIEVLGAEVYDPAQPAGSRWAALAPLPMHHRFHMRTLASGLVLFVGEDRGILPPPPPSAHVFDEGAGPTGAWLPTTGLSAILRYRATLTELPNGQVLYCGGYGGTGASPTYDTAELYDPMSGQWQPTAAMLQSRAGQAAVLLQTGPDAGRVLVMGGFVRPPGLDLAAAELYDHATASWLPAASMADARGAHTATRLPDGRVLVAGGSIFFPSVPLASVEIYDPIAGTWSPAASMIDARSFHTATLLQDGRVLVAGGQALGSPVQGTAELYDPGTDSWAVAGSMADARSHHRATRMPSGDVLVAGGRDLMADTLASAEVFVPPTCGVCGDTNGDGVANVLDALFAARHAAGLDRLAGCAFTRANAFGAVLPAAGAVVDTLDVLLIAQLAAGISVMPGCL